MTRRFRVTALLIGCDDDSVGGGADGRAVGSRRCPTPVWNSPSPLPVTGSSRWPETAGDGTHDGPHGWRRIGVQSSGVEAETAVAERRATEAADGGAAERCSTQGA